MPGPRSLLLRGDDAGATEGTNLALHACARAGVLRNVGFMACAPAFDHAADLFREPLPGVALGLHATVTSEWTSTLRWGPVLPRDQVPSLLASDGNFLRSTHALHERAAHDELLAEIEAQIRKARDSGLLLSYLDTHMVFNWLPGIQLRLESLAAREGLVMDIPESPNIHSLRVHPLDTLLNRIEGLAAGTTGRVVFHPVLLDEDAFLMFGDKPSEAVAQARLAEHQWLMDPANRKRIDALGATLITYRDL